MTEKEQRIFSPVLEAAGRLAEKSEPAMIAIDGRCGSGKTGLAELIRKHFSCNVLHMDDFYLPPDERQENWESVPGGNMDFERLKRELLVPLKEGRPALYRPYSCAGGTMGETVGLQPCLLTVVEGSYSMHPSMAAEYDLTVFLTCPKEEQRKRLQRREGKHFAAFEERWIPMEERYFSCFGIEGRCSLVVDTGGIESGGASGGTHTAPSAKASFQEAEVEVLF